MPRKTKHIKVTDQKKPWNKKKASKRPYKVESEEKKKAFLIICEGQNTEPEYFKSFPVKTAEVKSYGLGSTKVALVEAVIETIKDDKDKDTEYWVVFDMDINPNITAQKEDYEKAIQLAKSKGEEVAYANDAFELWVLLHYQYFDNQWDRRQYYSKLSELWNCNYEEDGKKHSFCSQIYKRLKNDNQSSQTEAIERAQKLLEIQKEIPLATQNPVTRIHILVKELNKYI